MTKEAMPGTVVVHFLKPKSGLRAFDDYVVVDNYTTNKVVKTAEEFTEAAREIGLRGLRIGEFEYIPPSAIIRIGVVGQ